MNAVIVGFSYAIVYKICMFIYIQYQYSGRVDYDTMVMGILKVIVPIMAYHECRVFLLVHIEAHEKS